jgi:hypothetical protein
MDETEKILMNPITMENYGSFRDNGWLGKGPSG